MIIPHRPIDYYREYHVSLWTGRFHKIEEVDAYFTEEHDPEHWSPSPFAVELGLGYYPPEYLEVNFAEDMASRPLLTFLMEAAFSESFIHAAFTAALDQRIYEAQGIALIYNFEYRAKLDWRQTVGPMWFIGVFEFDGHSSRAIYHEVAERAGCSVATVWFLLQAFREFHLQQRLEKGAEGTARAHEFCEFPVNAPGETTSMVVLSLPKLSLPICRKQAT